jgi:DNA-directed RNA polymerase subunit RPC12/RpoP
LSQSGLRSYACPNCGATQTFNPALRSLVCAFCGTQLVVKDEPTQAIATDRYIVPFALGFNQAFVILGNWLSHRSTFDLAPRDIMSTSQFEQGVGAYIPFWYYRCHASSNWTGQFGQVHYRPEIYWKNKQRWVRQAPYTVWFPTSGQHAGEQGAIVLASYGLTVTEADDFRPYPITHAVPDIAEYHFGFVTEEPACTADQAWEMGEYLIRTQERDACTQMTHQLTTANTVILSRSIWLIWMPIWIFGFWYKEKHFRIVLDGLLGKVCGDLPSVIDRRRRRR